MVVSEDIKALYREEGARKELTLNFPDMDVTLGNSQIISESMQLKESVMEGSDIEFIGCIASEFRIQIRGKYEKLEDERIVVTLKSGGKTIPLFHGTVEKAEMSDNRMTTEITAYDKLYQLSNVDIIDWYNETLNPGKDLWLNMWEILKLFSGEVGIALADDMDLTDAMPFCDLFINGNMPPLEELSALDFLKHICQLNASFGMINRTGQFELRRPLIIDAAAVDSYTGTPPLPDGDEIEEHVEEIESIRHFRNVKYETFATKRISRVVIRDDKKSKKTTYGEGGNLYTIIGNIFIYAMDETDREFVAETIWNRIYHFTYRPYSAENNGLPYLECGLDGVSYLITDYFAKTGNASRKRLFRFPLLSRTLTGIQSLKDRYDADGERDQRRFMTEIGTQLAEDVSSQSSGGGAGGAGGSGGNGRYLTYQTPGEVGQMAVSDGNGGVTWKSFGFSAPTGGYEYNDYNKEKNVFMQFNANYGSGGYSMIIGHSDADLSTFTLDYYEGYKFHFEEGIYKYKRDIIIYEGKVVMTNCEEISSGKRGFMVSEDMLTWTFIEDVPKKINGITNCYWSRRSVHCVGKNMIVTLYSSNQILLINPSNFEPIDTETQIVLPLEVSFLCFTGDTFFGFGAVMNGTYAMLVSQDCYKWDIVTIEYFVNCSFSKYNSAIWARGKILSSGSGYFVLTDKESSLKISISEKLGLEKNYDEQFAYNNSTKKFILMTYSDSRYYNAYVYQSDDGLEWELVKSYYNSFGVQHILCIDNTYILYSEKGIVYTKDFETFQASTILNNSVYSSAKIQSEFPMLYFTNDGFQHD